MSSVVVFDFCCRLFYPGVVLSRNALALIINVLLLLVNQPFVSFARLCDLYIVEELINGSVGRPVTRGGARGVFAPPVRPQRSAF